MTDKLEVLKEAGLDVQKGLEYTGGEDLYLSAAQRFFKNYEKNKAKVSEYYDAKDYQNYMITVHALKSNSKMIGALLLSGMFESLEMASKNNDVETIERENAEALKAYYELINRLKPIGEAEEIRAEGEISGEEAKEITDKLLDALDDFDDSMAKELAVTLNGYPFRLTQKEKLKEAIGFIEDFMYDEAAELIREIKLSID